MTTRVLFVDDESRVLEGLQRMLRSRRHEWEMVFAADGPSALAACDEAPFDVVVLATGYAPAGVRNRPGQGDVAG